MALKSCRDCKSLLNDRRSYPQGWDKGLCETCNEYYEFGQLTAKGKKKHIKYLKSMGVSPKKIKEIV
jgi:hypothetical protein